MTLCEWKGTRFGWLSPVLSIIEASSSKLYPVPLQCLHAVEAPREWLLPCAGREPHEFYSALNVKEVMGRTLTEQYGMMGDADVQ